MFKLILKFRVVSLSTTKINRDSMIEPSPKRKLLDSSKLKELTDNNKNLIKEKLLLTSNFSFSPQCFQTNYTADT